MGNGGGGVVEPRCNVFPVVVSIYMQHPSNEEKDTKKCGFLTEENTDGPTLASW